MLTLILGPAGSGKTASIFSDIRARVEARLGGAVLIVPEQYSHEAERELSRVCGDALSLYGEVLSFSRLAVRVLAETGGTAGTLLDAGGRLLVMAAAMNSIGARLTTYANARRRPDLQQALLDAIDELTAAGIGDEALETAARQTDALLGDKLRDLALIRAAYEAILAQGHADPTHRLTLLAERLAGSEMRSCTYYIDGFSDFTQQELGVIASLLAAGAPVSVCLTCGEDTSGEHPIPRATADALRRLAADAGVAVQERLCVPNGQGRASALRHLAQYLLNWGGAPQPADGAVALYACRDITQECELAATLARRLVRGQGCRWRDIAVAVRGFDEYRDALEAAFARWDVPLYLTRRSDILKKPLSVLVSSAFDIITGAWEYEDVFTYLKTGLAGLSREECDRLENYVFLWSLRGSAWTQDEDWSLHPAGTRQSVTEDTRAELAELNALRRRVRAPLMALREAGRAAFTAREQVRALTDYFTAIALPATLEARAAALTGAGQETLAAEYAQLWEILVRALEQMDAILGTSPMSQEEFARLFIQLLSCYDVGTIPIALDRVSAGDFDRMRRRQIRHLIVLGAGDERLPQSGSSGGIFSDDEREMLVPCGIDLGTRQESIDREMELIYSCLTLPSDSLTLSWSAQDESGEASPSFVVTRLAELFSLPVQYPDADALMAEAPLPALELAAQALRRGDPDAPIVAALREVPDGEARLAGLGRAGAYGRSDLSPEAVQALYGAQPRLSSTRIDAFSSCRFAYFLQYGLKARPRKSAGFEAPELGTFLHYVLEHVAGEARTQGGFSALDASTVDALTDRWIGEYVRQELGEFRGRTQRFIYLFRRLTDSVHQVVRDTAQELARSDFVPLDFELDFSDVVENGLESVAITGIADRVDGWLHDGRLYLRIADYKTGVKSFSLSDVWYGRSLQMLLYLFTLQKEGEARYGTPVIPAGVLYVPARDVLLPMDHCPSDEELDAERGKKLRRSGLLLDDPAVLEAMERGSEKRYLPVKYNKQGEAVGDALATLEQLGLLSKHIDRTLLELAQALRGGSVRADPWYRSAQENACLWCEYADACQWREGTDQPHYLKTLKPQEVYARMEGGGRDGV